MRNALFYVGILTLTLCALAGDGDGAAQISHENLLQVIREKKVVLLDCNSIDTYLAGHIPDAIHFASAGNELIRKLPVEKSAFIVVYCGSDHCPAYKKGEAALVKLGYTNFKHYAPGIKGWRESGEPMEVTPASKDYE